MFTCVRIHGRSHVRLHTHTTYIHMYTRKLYIYTYTCKYIYLHIVEQSCFLRPFHLHGFIFSVLSLSLSHTLSLTLSFSLSLPHWQFFRVIPIYIFIIFICLFSRALAIPLLISACSRFLPLTLSLVSSSLFSFALSFALCLSL